LIDAEEAARTRFINEVVPAAAVVPMVRREALAVAEGGPNALARTKELLTQFTKQAGSIEEAAKASAAPRLTEECRQGLEAFFAKRTVPWAPRSGS